MPRLYIAFQQNGTRVASGSGTEIRDKVRKYPDSQWVIYKYEFKAGVETFIILVEGDISKWGTPKLIEYVRVNAQGQARKFDPTKTQDAQTS